MAVTPEGTMYDFYFGSKQEIEKDKKKYLLSIKRMLPRWCNSIPDSEYLAIYDTLKKLKTNNKKRPILVETGTGASTIVMLDYVLQHNGILFSWDTSALKGSFLRSVITDTLLNHYRKNLHNHWKFIAFDSNSKYLGISILKDTIDEVLFSFHDSEHTLNVLLGEISKVNELLVDNSIVAIDDANYDYRHTNIAYINIFRKKMGLLPIDNPSDNTCKPFYVEVENFLKSKWKSVKYLKDTYKKNFKKDLFWSYFNADREIMSKVKMERCLNLKHRFDSWQVSEKIC